MAKNIFRAIKDVLDENELRQQRGIAERAADREARKDKIDAYLGRGTKTGNIGSRVDFSDEKKGPNFNVPKKITKKEVSVETPSGNIGSLDRTADVIASGPDMSKVVKPDVTSIVPTAREFDAMQQAQNLMSRGYNMKKGGAVKSKSKCMSSGGKISSASKRADGCATKGKTRGRMI
jgi:hypothetical protein